MENKSVYELICENITDGHLKSNFYFKTGNVEKDGWVPGATDGMRLYYGGASGMKEPGHEVKEELQLALECASGAYLEEADERFADVGTWYGYAGLDGAMQELLRKNDRTLNVNNLKRSAVYFAKNSRDVECIKASLEIMEYFGEPKEEVKDIIRTLGLYDEFTVFAVWNMKKWENGNEEIFRLARKVFGWGRVFAVQELEPTTEEIRRWFLMDGTISCVLDGYLSLTCWKKSEAESLLDERITYEEYRGLSALMDGLLDDIDGNGMSRLWNQDEILLKFLSHSKRFNLSSEDYELIWKIILWVQSEEIINPYIVPECEKLLQTDACQNVIKEAVKRGKAISLAKKIGLPYHADLFAYMETHFDKSYYLCNYLIDSEEYRERVIELFREKIQEKKTARADELSQAPTDIDNYLEAIALSLGRYPCTGEDLMKDALQSGSKLTRIFAKRSLRQWKRITGKPLSELSPELWELMDAF